MGAEPGQACCVGRHHLRVLLHPVRQAILSSRPLRNFSVDLADVQATSCHLFTQIAEAELAVRLVQFTTNDSNRTGVAVDDLIHSRSCSQTRIREFFGWQWQRIFVTLVCCCLLWILEVFLDLQDRIDLRLTGCLIQVVEITDALVQTRFNICDRRRVFQGFQAFLSRANDVVDLTLGDTVFRHVSTQVIKRIIDLCCTYLQHASTRTHVTGLQSANGFTDRFDLFLVNVDCAYILEQLKDVLHIRTLLALEERRLKFIVQ